MVLVSGDLLGRAGSGDSAEEGGGDSGASFDVMMVLVINSYIPVFVVTILQYFVVQYRLGVNILYTIDLDECVESRGDGGI